MKFNLKVLSAVTILLGLLCNQAIFASSASKQKPEKKDEANLNQNKEKQKEKKGTDAIKENYVMPSDKVMPNDSQVRYGKLDNGLTYYIRKNQKPENRAEFYIAQNVGSILEEEEQRGLAHFLEHMAFNGTKNFPDNTLREYLEKNGVKFGANLNAYTSIDETVYNISSVPTTNPGLVDSCLLILHDWSGCISLEEQAIDDERPVIHEEWRTRSSASMRAYEKLLPVFYPGSRYADRMPIGLMEVVDNFDYDVLRDYYKKWYRPDLQAIIIVGDIDPDYIETKIKELWADIPASENPAERTYLAVEQNIEPRICINTDKENTNNTIQLAIKKEKMSPEERATEAGFINTLAESIVISIMNERFSDAAKKPDAPFLGASFSSNNFFISKTMGAYFLGVSYKENNWGQAFGEAIKMLYSAKEHGFTDAEIERAKKRYLKSYENQYNEREKMNNSAFVGSYKNSFTSGNSFPSIETYYEVINKYLPEYPNELINSVLKENIKGINENILVNGIDKEEFIIPNETEVLAFFNEAKQQQFEAYAEKEIKSTLIDKLPKKGKIKKEKKTDYETTTLTLSNGAQIIVKNTDFNKSNIAFNCFKRGGTSMYPDDNTWSLSFLTNSLFIGGVGEFSVQDLNKAIAGKSFSLSPYMRKVSQGIQGSTTPEDLEAMLQTLYLYFTASRKDQEVFDATIKKVGVSLQNSKGTPQQIFSDSLLHTLYNHHPKGRNFRFEDIDSLDYDRLFEIQKQAFSNGGDFKFIFVGNIDLEKAKPLFEQYIGSLPSTKKSVEPELDDLYIAEGLRENRFETRMQTPKVTVLNAYTGAIDYNLKNIISVNLFQQIMSMVYTKTIREEEGGTYGVSVRANIDDARKRFTYQYSFDTNEEKRQQLEDRAFVELKNIAENGPSEEFLGNAVEYSVKSYNDNIKTNGYWVSAISMRESFGLERHNEYIDILKSVSTNDIKDIASYILDQNNRVQVVCTGIEAE